MIKIPDHLGPDGSAFYRAIVTDYGVSDAAGKLLASTAAECLDRMRQAQKLIEEHGRQAFRHR